MLVRNASGDACREMSFKFDHVKGKVALQVRFDDPKSLQNAILALARVEKQWREDFQPGNWTSIVLTCVPWKDAPTAPAKPRRRK